jgi:hypothetical protein
VLLSSPSSPGPNYNPVSVENSDGHEKERVKKLRALFALKKDSGEDLKFESDDDDNDNAQCIKGNLSIADSALEGKGDNILVPTDNPNDDHGADDDDDDDDDDLKDFVKADQSDDDKVQILCSA